MAGYNRRAAANSARATKRYASCQVASRSQAGSSSSGKGGSAANSASTSASLQEARAATRSAMIWYGFRCSVIGVLRRSLLIPSKPCLAPIEVRQQAIQPEKEKPTEARGGTPPGRDVGP